MELRKQRIATLDMHPAYLVSAFHKIGHAKLSTPFMQSYALLFNYCYQAHELQR